MLILHEMCTLKNLSQHRTIQVNCKKKKVYLKIKKYRKKKLSLASENIGYIHTFSKFEPKILLFGGIKCKIFAGYPNMSFHSKYDSCNTNTKVHNILFIWTISWFDIDINV